MSTTMTIEKMQAAFESIRLAHAEQAVMILDRQRELPELPFTREQKAEALRHAADWVDEGAPGGRRSQLFSPLYDVDKGDGGLWQRGTEVAVERCALGEAMLFLNDDWRAWDGYGLSQVFGGEPEVVGVLSAAMYAFDADAYGQCSEQLRLAADNLAPVADLVPA